MFIWVEWICKKCSELHSARFDVIIYAGAFHSRATSRRWKDGRSRTYYEDGDLKIDDVAYNRENRPRKTKGGGSKIFAPFNTEIPRLVEAVGKYMHKYYGIKENTLTLEVCSA
jgi:hypothetical protein